MSILDLPSEPTPGIPYFSPNQDPPAETAIPEEGKALLLTFQPFQSKISELDCGRASVPIFSQKRIRYTMAYSSAGQHRTTWSWFNVYGNNRSVGSRQNLTPRRRNMERLTHIQPWKDITTYAHSPNQKIGIQLGHAGRKASAVAPFLHFSMQVTEAVGGWPRDVVRPGGESFAETFPTPRALTTEEVKCIVQAFKETAIRAVKVGFDVIEIHDAHAYLLHSLLSPYTNKRTDKYGGSFENRICPSLEVSEGSLCT
ncbi:nadph dehydrogenase [Moniliophthora roreri MCA 2997]|uniref:Nadph dehydrogenase n=2 Tax=Moniliophthora roreri TaxID=221103 RepID=V2WYF5_MONRO|nr:nadph dehydrogenase [Moniliophthora roreri MCA 2997]